MCVWYIYIYKYQKYYGQLRKDKEVREDVPEEMTPEAPRVRTSKPCKDSEVKRFGQQ